jgi:hypothetical protein
MNILLNKIKDQQSDRWYLDEVLYDRLIYRTNFVIDPFAAMEFVLKREDPNKAYVLFKGEENRPGMELFFQKEISIDKYLSIADGMSDMFFNFII